MQRETPQQDRVAEASILRSYGARGRAALHALALLIASAVAAMAMAASSAPWAQEPVSMFGISIGQRFPAAGEIEDCPLFEPFRREPQPKDLCVDTGKGFSADAVALKYVPLGSLLADASVELRDGLVRAITVTFDRRHYAATRALLVEQYGPSHTRVADESGEVLTWAGAHVAMRLRENLDDRGHAALEIRAPSATAAR